MELVNTLHAEHGAYAEFLYVYIAEAHAADEWPLGSAESVPQPTELTERLARARRLREAYGVDTGIHIAVDGMENAFDGAFAVWPERFFVLHAAPLSPALPVPTSAPAAR